MAIRLRFCRRFLEDKNKFFKEMKPAQMDTSRYMKQILLKEFGTASQEKLLDAKVLLVGAGGLGCPALLYLGAAGVGTIGIADFDTIDISNLQRQIIYKTADIGKSKAEQAAHWINKLNPGITVHALNIKIQNSNALELISPYDLVIDGSDNFSTRYLLNDACILLNKPLIYGAVLRFEGQVGVFNLPDKKTNEKTNYRHLFPQPPDDASAISCNEAGVLGVLPGIIGTMQATEAIKIITGIGNPLCNRILSYNALDNSFYEISVSTLEPAVGTFPENETAFLNFDYSWFCKTEENNYDISSPAFDDIMSDEKITIVDVRETDELPEVNEFHHLNIPMSAFQTRFTEIDTTKKVVLFCQTGIRSLKAAKILKSKFPDCRVYSLTGGIKAWKLHQLNIPV